MPSTDKCENYCENNGICKKNDEGEPFCECSGSFTGSKCQVRGRTFLGSESKRLKCHRCLFINTLCWGALQLLWKEWYLRLTYCTVLVFTTHIQLSTTFPPSTTLSLSTTLPPPTSPSLPLTHHHLKLLHQALTTHSPSGQEQLHILRGRHRWCGRLLHPHCAACLDDLHPLHPPQGTKEGLPTPAIHRPQRFTGEGGTREKSCVHLRVVTWVFSFNGHCFE